MSIPFRTIEGTCNAYYVSNWYDSHFDLFPCKGLFVLNFNYLYLVHWSREPYICVVGLCLHCFRKWHVAPTPCHSLSQCWLWMHNNPEEKLYSNILIHCTCSLRTSNCDGRLCFSVCIVGYLDRIELIQLWPGWKWYTSIYLIWLAFGNLRYILMDHGNLG